MVILLWSEQQRERKKNKHLPVVVIEANNIKMPRPLVERERDKTLIGLAALSAGANTKNASPFGRQRERGIKKQ